ncbi:hypothetical protein M378DRAFT_199371 [Amanita muscaria Koide BX008]|uniref:Uncharacterized protein n=1 Tax=Amanita muscaria (strain Koide BX008) TaxID=946122 RepID=A0A0C2WZX0_AMAMK|nr:hypothetical protein M378DRAFT_199371 [Amanita muscaria Koide BX008]
MFTQTKIIQVDKKYPEDFRSCLCGSRNAVGNTAPSTTDRYDGISEPASTTGTTLKAMPVAEVIPFVSNMLFILRKDSEVAAMGAQLNRRGPYRFCLYHSHEDGDNGGYRVGKIKSTDSLLVTAATMTGSMEVGRLYQPHAS